MRCGLRKRVKSIRGTEDTFHRLRVGDHRVMYDVIDSDRVTLVLGVVDRADLERWPVADSTQGARR